MNIVVLLAGGMGSRMNAATAKQHLIIRQHQIIEYTIMAFSVCKSVDSILVVSNAMHLKEVEDLKIKFQKLKYVIEGGSTRIESVLNAVKALQKICNENDKIIISDAARPCITTREIEDILCLLDKNIAVTSGIESYETILKTENGEISQIINRDGIVRQTSPEGYRFSTLKWLYIDANKEIISSYKNIGIDQLYGSGVKVGIVKSNPLNFKITTQSDLQLFDTVVKNGFYKFLENNLDTES